MIVSTMRLILLGRFALAGPDAPIIDWRWSRRRAAAILKLLGLADQHMAHREQIMEALWPDLPPSHAANQLYKNLHWLRRAVLDSGLPRPVVAISREVVRLDSSVEVDVDRFRSVARAALAASDDPAKVEAALRAYGGELLPDDGLEEWTIAPRAELHTLWRSLASLRADQLRTRGEDASAAAQLLEILEVEPWDESAHRRLMQIHLAAGERDAALHRFRACREALRREFGVEPGPETQAVARQVIDAQLAKIDDPDSGPVGADLLERLADVRRQTGDVAGSATLYGRALSVEGTFASSKRRSRLLSKAALSSILSGDINEGSTLLDELQRSLSGEMPRYVTSRTYLILSQLRWHSGRYAEALDAAERAVAQSTSGTVVEQAHALEMVALACHSLGAWQRGLEAELARHALEIEDGFDVDEAFEGHACLWEYHLYGDLPYSDVENLVRKALRQAERSGNRRAMALALLALGSVLFLVGRWTESEDTFERSIDLADVVEAEMLAIHGHQRLALLESASGRIEAALLRLVSAIDRAEGSSSAQVWHHSRSRLYATLARNRLQAGAVEAAADAVDAAEAVRRDAGSCLTCDALLHPVSVPVRLAAGDIGAARSSAQNAVASGDVFRSGGWRAAAAHSRGLLSMREGDLRAAIRELETACRSFAVLGQPYDEARSLEAVAAARRGLGAKGRHRSQAASRRASILYERLGAVGGADALAWAHMSGKAGRRSVS